MYKEKIAANSIILKKDNFVELRTIKNPEDKIFGYTYSHEIRCDGNIIAILPYKKEDNSIKFLSRVEATPCWEYTNPVMSSLTGGVDKNNTPLKTAQIELREEAGYIVNEDEIIPLGTTYSTKSSDSVYHLFAVEITQETSKIKAVAESELEKTSYCKWVSKEEIIEAKDPFIIVLMTKLLQKVEN